MPDRPISMMPARLDLGKLSASAISMPMGQRRHAEPDPLGRPLVMGFVIPDWQRPLVWNTDQMIRFIQSAWMGLNLGTFTYNLTDEPNPLTDNVLVDGQQRLWAIEQYLDDAFPVFGHHYSELPPVDTRRFSNSTQFSSYRLETTDEDFLRRYYDMMNFGGVAHTEEQRAAPSMK
jgi:hypothetical protein